MSAVPFYVKINGPVGFWHFSLDVIPAAGFAVSIMCVGFVASALSSVRSLAFFVSENIPQAHFFEPVRPYRPSSNSKHRCDQPAQSAQSAQPVRSKSLLLPPSPHPSRCLLN